jgi:agmatinase
MTHVSKAITINKVQNYYEVTNFITGRSFKINENTKLFLDFCKKPRSHTNIVEYFQNNDINIKKGKEIVNKLFNTKVLITNDKKIFYDTIPAIHPLFGLSKYNYSPVKSVIFIGAPFGSGNSIDIKCKDFPKHIREFAYFYFSCKKFSEEISQFRKDSVDETFDYDNFCRILSHNLLYDDGDILTFSGESNILFYDKLKKITKEILRYGNIPFFIGGDHSITFPITETISNQGIHFDIIQFDAHSDCNNGRTIKLYDNLGLELLNHANVMTYCSKISQVDHIIQLGVREPFVLSNNKVISISLNDIRTKSTKYQNYARSKRNVYISFDIDFFDPQIVQGTASILPNGGLYHETLICLKEILENKNILGIDIVEANHHLDKTDQTSVIMLNLILYLIGLIKNL